MADFKLSANYYESVIELAYPYDANGSAAVVVNFTTETQKQETGIGLYMLTNQMSIPTVKTQLYWASQSGGVNGIIDTQDINPGIQYSAPGGYVGAWAPLLTVARKIDISPTITHIGVRFLVESSSWVANGVWVYTSYFRRSLNILGVKR